MNDIIKLFVFAHFRKRLLQNLLVTLGISLGVSILIISLNLTNGFSDALLQSTLKVTPHLSVLTDKNDKLEEFLKNNTKVKAFAPYIVDKALLTRPSDGIKDAGTDFSTIFGFDENILNVLNFSEKEANNLRSLGENEIMLGSALAQNILAFPNEQINILNSGMNREIYTVQSYFLTGNYLIDSAYSFVSLKSLQQIQKNNKISGYQIRMKDPKDAMELKKQIGGIAWQEIYANLLSQIELQKKVISFILFLMVIVASFGIISIMTLLVFEKTQEIAILRAMGLSQNQIVYMYFIKGFLIGVFGIFLGNIIGLGVSYYFIVKPFSVPADLYFISTLPIKINYMDIVFINIFAIVVVLFSSVIPAKRVAKTEPAKLLR